MISIACGAHLVEHYAISDTTLSCTSRKFELSIRYPTPVCVRCIQNSVVEYEYIPRSIEKIDTIHYIKIRLGWVYLFIFWIRGDEIQTWWRTLYIPGRAWEQTPLCRNPCTRRPRRRACSPGGTLPSRGKPFGLRRAGPPRCSADRTYKQEKKKRNKIKKATIRWSRHRAELKQTLDE